MKTGLTVLCVLSLLHGCAQGDAAPLVAAAPAPVADASIAAYKRALLPLFAGSYEGRCKLFPGTANAPALRIGADGRASAPGIEHDLMDDGVEFILAREFVDGRASEAHVIAGQASPKWGVFLNTGNDEMARLGHEGAALRCGASQTLRDLKTRSLHAAIGGYLASPPRSLACIVAMHERQTLSYQADAAQIRLGGHVFALTGAVQGEQVMLGRALSYRRDYAGGVRIIVTLDAAGTLAEVAATAPGGVSYYCKDA